MYVSAYIQLHLQKRVLYVFVPSCHQKSFSVDLNTTIQKDKIDKEKYAKNICCMVFI